MKTNTKKGVACQVANNPPNIRMWKAWPAFLCRAQGTDMYDAHEVIQNTPTFVVLNVLRNTPVNGSRPADRFITMIGSLLDQEEQSGSQLVTRTHL